MMVAVYRCIPRRLWSIRRDGRVVDHRESLVLANCTMHVREGARQRVIECRQRSVHAWVIGALEEGGAEPGPGWHELGYNPYLAATFTKRPGFAPVHTARRVLFRPDGRCFFQE